MKHLCPYCGVDIYETSAVHRCAGPTVELVLSQVEHLRTRAEKAEARVGHLEAECAKLRGLVSEAYRDGFAAGCFPNANVDDAWPQSMTFADLNAEANHD